MYIYIFETLSPAPKTRFAGAVRYLRKWRQRHRQAGCPDTRIPESPKPRSTKPRSPETQKP